MDRSRDSVREAQDDSKYFCCEWVYMSDDGSRTLFYAILAALILTDNKIAFKYFEDKINDALSDEESRFSENELNIITRQWQKIGELLTKGKVIRWQKNLN
jgi:hypothetical protein